MRTNEPLYGIERLSGPVIPSMQATQSTMMTIQPMQQMQTMQPIQQIQPILSSVKPIMSNTLPMTSGMMGMGFVGNSIIQSENNMIKVQDPPKIIYNVIAPGIVNTDIGPLFTTSVNEPVNNGWCCCCCCCGNKEYNLDCCRQICCNTYCKYYDGDLKICYLMLSTCCFNWITCKVTDYIKLCEFTKCCSTSGCFCDTRYSSMCCKCHCHSYPKGNCTKYGCNDGCWCFKCCK